MSIHIGPKMFKHIGIHCGSMSCPWAFLSLFLHSQPKQLRPWEIQATCENQCDKMQKEYYLRDQQICLQILALAPPIQVSSFSLRVPSCPNGIKPISWDRFMERLQRRMVGPSFCWVKLPLNSDFSPHHIRSPSSQRCFLAKCLKWVG